MIVQPLSFNVYSAPTIVAMVLFWVLGLYVLTRSPHSRISNVAAAALFATAFYLFGDVMLANAQTPDQWLGWAGKTFLGASAAPALWFWLTVLLIRAEVGPTGRGYLVRVAYPLGALLGVTAVTFAALAPTSGPLLIWDRPVLTTPAGSARPFVALPGPFYGWFVLDLVVACGFAIGHTAWLVRNDSEDDALRARHRWFLYVAIALFVSPLYLAVNVWRELGIPMWPGHVGLAIGLCLMAWNVARYSALLSGRVLRSDFLAFSMSHAGLVIVYGATMTLLFVPFTHTHLALAVSIVLLAGMSHALSAPIRKAIDHLFFSREVQSIRSDFRQLADEAAVAPGLHRVLEEARDLIDRADEAEMRRLVEHALRRLNDLPALAKHPLLERLSDAVSGVDLPAESGQEGRTPLTEARALRQLLIDHLNRLKPDGDPPKILSGGWLQYVILKEAYVDGRPNKQIMRSHEISEGTFHRSRRQAIAGLAADLSRLTSKTKRSAS